MKDTEKVLQEELSKIFEGQLQRLPMLSKLIIALLKMSTVSYSKLCVVLNAQVKKDSNFKRIQRFMKAFDFCRISDIRVKHAKNYYRERWGN